jgi:hypothetical protein
VYNRVSHKANNNFRVSGTVKSGGWRGEFLAPTHATAASQASVEPGSAFSLLCACCSLPLGLCDDKSPVANSEAQWEQLFAEAEKHDVNPMVHAALSRHPEAAPAAVWQSFRQAAQVLAQRNLRFTFELNRILKGFERHQIAVIPFKGPALAELAYGNFALRQYSDLDLLVRPADVEAARISLQEAGFAPSKAFSAAQQAALLHTGYERAFDGPGAPNLVELQWQLLPRFYSVDLSMDELFSRAVPLDLGGQSIRSLAPEDLVIAICLHAAKHAWVRLSWLCDLAAAARTLAIDWGLLAQRTGALRIRRMVGITFWLAEHLLGLTVPAPIAETMRQDREINAIGQDLVPLISGPAHLDPDSFAYFRLMLRAREARLDRARMLWRLAVTPAEGEWAVATLPAPLFPLYLVIRLGRLAGRAFGRRRG